MHVMARKLRTTETMDLSGMVDDLLRGTDWLPGGVHPNFIFTPFRRNKLNNRYLVNFVGR